jgi:hypothetical protein
MAFVVGAYQAIEHPGAGHRAGRTSLWRGEDLRTGDEVAMTLLPADRAEDARAAVAAVEVTHPHLLPVIDVVTGEATQDDERVAVVCPWPAGGRLAELVARRGRLTVGETLTVLIPMASALAAAHAGGVRHGEVCPESIWFDGQGRPQLGALAVGRIVTGLNDGLPEGSRDVAPEVVRGESVRRGPVTPAADVFSLGSVALRCLTGRSAWPADDPADVLVQSAAGVWPDPPDDAGPVAMIELVRAMLRADPGRRPSAQTVQAELSRVPGAAPIDFGSGPARAPASADRWRGWSVAAREDVSSVTPARAGASRDGQLPADSAVPTVTSGAVPNQPPASVGDEPGRLSPLVRTGIGLLVGLLITVVALQVGLWWSGWDNPAGPAASLSGGSSTDAGSPNWLDLVVALDAARGRALAEADPELLADVYVQASPAAEADSQLIARLADQGLRVVDGRHEIVSVSPVDPAAGPDPPTVRLAIVDVLPTHPVVDVAGQQVGSTPGRAEQRRVLVLNATDDGYRISGVEPG